MPEADNVTPQPPPEPTERRGFPWFRVMAAVTLAAAAGAVMLSLKAPSDLVLDARFEPASPAPGEVCRLILHVSPRRDSEYGPAREVRATVTAPSDLDFERDSEFQLPGESAVVFSFTVARGAKPGPRKLSVLVSARLPAGRHRSVARTAELRRTLEVVVAPKAEGAPAGVPAAAGGEEKGGGS